MVNNIATYICQLYVVICGINTQHAIQYIIFYTESKAYLIPVINVHTHVPVNQDFSQTSVHQISYQWTMVSLYIKIVHYINYIIIIIIIYIYQLGTGGCTQGQSPYKVLTHNN